MRLNKALPFASPKKQGRVRQWRATRRRGLYASTAARLSFRCAEHNASAFDPEGREIIGPAHKPGNPKRLLDVDRLDIDVANRAAVCPTGHTSRKCSLINDTYNAVVHFRLKQNAWPRHRHTSDNFHLFYLRHLWIKFLKHL